MGGVEGWDVVAGILAVEGLELTVVPLVVEGLNAVLCSLVAEEFLVVLGSPVVEGGLDVLGSVAVGGLEVARCSVVVVLGLLVVCKGVVYLEGLGSVVGGSKNTYKRRNFISISGYAVRT